MDQRRAEPVRFDDEAAAKVEEAELEAAWGCIISSMFAAFRANQVAATATAAANGRRQMAIISTGKKAVPREVCEEPFFDGGDLRGARAVGL